MAWFSLAKIALQAGSKIYANRQKTKMAMSDAQLMHAEKMARGEEANKLIGEIPLKCRIYAQRAQNFPSTKLQFYFYL